MKKKSTLIVLLLAVAVLCLGFACQKVKPTPTEDTTAPVITVANVPETCKVGDTVTVPAATAQDDVDGDLTDSVLVTVYQFKEDGTTINREMINGLNANVENTFAASSNKFLAYQIVYTVTDAAGNTAELKFNLTAVADTQTGTLVINESSVDGFSLEAGISAKAGEDIMLPSATAIDQPGDVDISELVTARLFEVIDGQPSSTVFAMFENFKEAKAVRIPAGQYQLVYGVTDAAGNRFEQTYTTSVTVAQPDEVNLAGDPDNFAFDTDDGRWVNGKPGLSWINNYGELAFGNTSDEPNIDQTVGFTSAVTKIHEQIVAVTFNADAPTTNGQMFYTMSARGSKNRTTLPNKETCTWPDYLFIRIGTGGIESRVERQSDKEMNIVKGYNGASLLDGNDHTIYIQWANVGEAPTAEDACIELRGWVDTVPAGRENASFIFSATVGESIDKGTLTQAIFTELWNQSTGAGWFTMDTYSSTRPHDDDHMRIKALVIYDKDEVAFANDITPPVVSVEFTAEAVYSTGEAIAIPAATVEGADTVTAYIYNEEGDKQAVEGSFTPAAAGMYLLSYEAVDEAGNLGYKFFNLKVADKDEVAPELTIADMSEINVNVGDKVTLPTATAIDDQDGDISANVTIEIIGTEHVTDRMPGGDYYPMTAGAQTVIYSVADTYGNVAQKQIIINVASVASGNMITTELFSNGTGVGLTSSEYIYDQKVSTIINISKLTSIVQFNMRGPVLNADWPKGMVVRFVQDGTITVSANGHDGAIFGSTSYSKQRFMIGCDILFEYQTTNVEIGGEKYIKVQLWVQGEELVFSANPTHGGIVGLEEDVNALYRKLSDFKDSSAESIYSSPFWVSAYGSEVTVKEVRIDGTSCEKPADPVVPEGYELQFATGNEFVTEEKTLAGGGDYSAYLGKNSNEDYIAITFKGEAIAKGNLCFNFTGAVNGWSGGLILRISEESFELHVGGFNNEVKAWLGGCPYSSASGINANEYTVVYKMTYTSENGFYSAVTVEVWMGPAGGTLAKCEFAALSSDMQAYASVSEDKMAITIKSSAFASAAEMTPADITAVVLGAMNGDCDWAITGIEKLAVAPGMEADGYANPTNSNQAVVNVTEELTAPATTDTVIKAVTDLNEKYVQVTAKHTADPTYYGFGINVLGSTDNGWTAGLVLAMTHDGHYFRLGGVNSANLVQLNFYSMGKGAEYTVGYQIKYIMVGDNCTHVQIKLWQGLADGTLAVVAPHGETMSGDKWEYDSELKAFIFDYDIVAENMFAPDCTLIFMQAFNDKEVDCDWTVTKVEVYDVPVAEAAGYVNPLNSNAAVVNVTEEVTALATTDTILKAVTDLNDKYVQVTAKHTANPTYYALGINLLGSTDNGWTAGLVLAMTQDGHYFRLGGVNSDAGQIQLNFYSMGNGAEYTVGYQVSYVMVGAVCTQVKVQVWQGLANGELAVVAPHGGATGSTGWSYNTAEGAFYFDYNIFAENMFAPDCTLICMQAFNDREVDCDWTITKVEVSERK